MEVFLIVFFKSTVFAAVMKVLAACLLLALGVSAQEAGGNIITPKTATRMLRADVLRGE